MHAFASYLFNGYEVDESSLPRITGKPVSAIRKPDHAVLVGESRALFWRFMAPRSNRISIATPETWSVCMEIF